MDAAANLTGAARAKAYQKLDYQIMKQYAPWVPYSIVNGVFFVSARTHNYIYSVLLRRADLQRALRRLATDTH